MGSPGNSVRDTSSSNLSQSQNWTPIRGQVWAPIDTFDDIVDHCCYAWNILIDQPWKIMSIARREWAIVGQSI
jgi:hypothetical protein